MKTPDNKSTATKDAYQQAWDDGFEAGRLAEREHCNNVLRNFWKTFSFPIRPTLEDTEKHNAEH